MKILFGVLILLWASVGFSETVCLSDDSVTIDDTPLYAYLTFYNIPHTSFDVDGCMEVKVPRSSCSRKLDVCRWDGNRNGVVDQDDVDSMIDRMTDQIGRDCPRR